MEELKLIYTHKGGPYGDCMSSYDISLNRPCSLGEFVDAILKRKGEWGEIRIGDINDRKVLPMLEYRYGKVVSSEFKKDDLRNIVKSVFASYGYTCGNYWVEIIKEK